MSIVTSDMLCYCMCHQISSNGQPMAVHCMPCCAVCSFCHSHVTFATYEYHEDRCPVRVAIENMEAYDESLQEG